MILSIGRVGVGGRVGEVGEVGEAGVWGDSKRLLVLRP